MMDLSKLPAPLRERLESRLDRLSADARGNLLAKLEMLPTPMLEKLLDHGSPMLDKLIERLDQQASIPDRSSATLPSAAKPSAFTPVNSLSSHYNKTVQRGDNLSLRTLVVVLILGGVLILLYQSGLLGS